MSQLVINPEGQPVGAPGQSADNGQGDVQSRFNGEASAGIPFGVGVKLDATKIRAVKLLSASTDVVEGVVWRGYDHQPGVTGDLDANGNLKPAAQTPVMVKGRILVVVEETVAEGDRAYVRYETDGGSNTQPGAWRKSSDGHTLDVRRNCIFRSAAGAGGLASLEVDFTIKSS